MDTTLILSVAVGVVLGVTVAAVLAAWIFYKLEGGFPL